LSLRSNPGLDLANAFGVSFRFPQNSNKSDCSLCCNCSPASTWMGLIAPQSPP